MDYGLDPYAEPSLSLGRALSIEVHCDFTLLAVVPLIAIELGWGVLPRWHPEWSLAQTWLVAGGVALLFLASVLVDELARAWAARREGLVIRRFTLFPFGGLVHADDEPTSARPELSMALTGVLVSFALAASASWLGSALAESTHARGLLDAGSVLRAAGPTATVLLLFGAIEFALWLFNLLPAFPLDGGRLLRMLLWRTTGSLPRATRWATAVGHAFAWSIVALGTIDILCGYVSEGAWIMLIGGCLGSAAAINHRRILASDTLHDVSVATLMRTRLDSVPPGLSVDALVWDHLSGSDQRSFPVESDGQLLGLVTPDDVRKLDYAAWRSTDVASVMTPLDQLVTLPPEAAADRALAELSTRHVNQIPVVDHGRLVGMVILRDVRDWITLHADQPAHA